MWGDLRFGLLSFWSEFKWSFRGYRDEDLQDKVFHDVWPVLRKEFPDLAYEEAIDLFRKEWKT